MLYVSNINHKTITIYDKIDHTIQLLSCLKKNIIIDNQKTSMLLFIMFNKKSKCKDLQPLTIKYFYIILI